MNLSGLSFQSIVLKHIFKQSHYPKANYFTIRNTSHGRKPVLFDVRRERDKRNFKDGVQKYNSYSSSSDMSCCCLGAWKNHIFSSGFHTTSGNYHGEYEWQDPKSEDEVVNVQVADKDGNITNVRGKIGDNLLYLSKRFDVGMEGACEASLACTTCHVYIDYDFLDLLPESTETEEDLLDQAPFLRENSRLGCQIILNKQLDGLKLALPSATKNFYVDGHKPTPH